MRRLAVLCLALLVALPAARAEDTPDSKPAGRGCSAVSADLAAARATGRLKDATALYAEAGEARTGCEPKVLFCLGRSLALAHVEAAYAAAGKGSMAAAARLFADGSRFGEPWPLLVGLGDGAGSTARGTHDPRRWGEASLAYQKAIAALDEPSLCPDEPPLPDTQAYDQILRKMSLATLLANPVPLFHSKCAPCGLAFLAHGPIAPDHPRPIPITFEPRNATITPEGLLTAKALADCARQGHWSKLVVSAHTDDRGSDAINQVLSDQRLQSLRHALQDDGYAGKLDGDPKGKSEPLAIDEPRDLSAAELQRANRRIELRSILGAPPLSCARSEAPAP